MGLDAFFAIAYTLGPAAAIPYGNTLLDPTAIFLVLFVAYTAPLPILFYMFGLLQYAETCRVGVACQFARLTNYSARKFKRGMADNIVNEFYKQWGDLGFYVSIAFLSFAFGFLWAAVIAYMMKLRRKAAYIAIAIGNIAGLIFWFLVAQGVLGFVDPLVFMLFVLFMSLNFFVYGEFRERSVLMRMRNLIPKEMGIRKKVLHRLRE